jgi:hypothetical protein
MLKFLTDTEINALLRQSRPVRPHVCPGYDCGGVVACGDCGAITPDCQREGGTCRDCLAQRQRSALRYAAPSLMPVRSDVAMLAPGIFVPVGGGR